MNPKLCLFFSFLILFFTGFFIAHAAELREDEAYAQSLAIRDHKAVNRGRLRGEVPLHEALSSQRTATTPSGWYTDSERAHTRTRYPGAVLPRSSDKLNEDSLLQPVQAPNQEKVSKTQVGGTAPDNSVIIPLLLGTFGLVLGVYFWSMSSI